MDLTQLLRRVALGSAVAALALAAVPARASILDIPDEDPVETRVVTDLGTFVAGFVNVPFVSIPDADFSGRFWQAVYREADNTLTLYYQFINDASSGVAIARITAGNFDNVEVDAYELGAGSTLPQGLAGLAGVSPQEFDRGSASDGRSVGFDYEAGGNAATRLQAGQQTTVLALNTNRSTLSAGSVSGIDGGDAFGIVAFDVTDDAAIPEPTSMALLGAGLIGLAVARRVRRA